MVSPAAAGLLPGMEGLHTAVVKKLDGDPSGECRIQVELPWLEGENKLIWARLSTLYGTNGSGTFWLPEPDDEVLVGFVNNDPAHPVILGSIYGAKHKPPYEYTAENNMKALVTRKKLKIEFDEEKKIITVSTPGNNKVELNDEGTVSKDSTSRCRARWAQPSRETPRRNCPPAARLPLRVLWS